MSFNLFNNYTELKDDSRLTRTLEQALTQRDNYQGCDNNNCGPPILNYPTEINKNFSSFNYYKRLNEDNLLGNLFFSSKNIDNIQLSIRRNVFEQKQYNISKQNVMRLLEIMRLVYQDYGTDKITRKNITEQIKFLNEKVILIAVKSIIGNIEDHLYYLDNLGNLAKYISSQNPQMTSSSGTKTLIYKPSEKQNQSNNIQFVS